uniref:Cytochrome P450 n=2 Tax=Arion vulgaris TaxID=1028688 RepID=A0A0B7AM89_9EUPU
MDLVLLLVTIIFLLVIFIWFQRPDPNLPPCPSRPLPIVGHIFVLQEDSRAQFKKWRHQLGDLFSIYMGRKLAVVVSSYELLKEILVKKGDGCLNRPDMFVDIATGIPKKGVIASPVEEWREQRAVTISILRAFGMGKNILAEKIKEEAKCYTDVLADLQGKPTDIRMVTNLSMCNIVCSVIIGERFQYDDKVIQDLMITLNLIIADFNPSSLVTFIPVLKYVPGDLFRTKRIQSSARKVMDLFVNKFVRSKANEKSDDGEQDNFVATYMREWKQKIKSNEPTTMNEDHLSKIIWDLFNAGTETTATTVIWCVLYAITHPEVQDKIYAEIVAEIGTERPPSIQDKPKLVYLNAFIMESQRLASIAALAIAHECNTDITIRNYTLPKGTIIIPNIDSVSYDEKIWGENVHTLKPERFIDDNGKLKNPEEFIPFGIGKRVCLGEGWAKMILFLYLSTIFQRFQVLPSNSASPPTLDYVFGLDVHPTHFEARFVNRNMDN